MSSPTEYRLLYFNVRSRGELIRYIFKYAGVNFEDDRSPSERWQEIKPTTPFGQVPALYVNGEELSGTQAIARYLAEKFGLDGQNSFENAKIASIVDASDDVITWLGRIKWEQDESRKEELIKTIGSTLPMRLKKMEDRMGKEGFIFGSKLTYADFAVHLIVDYIIQTGCFPNMMEGFPKLLKLRDDVANIPSIKKWIEQRPECNYYKIKD